MLVDGVNYNIGYDSSSDGESYYVETTGIGGMKSHLGVVRQRTGGRWHGSWELWYAGQGTLLWGFWDKEELFREMIRYYGIVP